MYKFLFYWSKLQINDGSQEINAAAEKLHDANVNISNKHLDSL